MSHAEQLFRIWSDRAKQHELSAREIEEYGDDSDSSDLALHREVAVTLRRCITELLHPELFAEATTAEEIKF